MKFLQFCIWKFVPFTCSNSSYEVDIGVSQLTVLVLKLDGSWISQPVSFPPSSPPRRALLYCQGQPIQCSLQKGVGPVLRPLCQAYPHSQHQGQLHYLDQAWCSEYLPSLPPRCYREHTSGSLSSAFLLSHCQGATTKVSSSVLQR